jgi:hypothetical protein
VNPQRFHLTLTSAGRPVAHGWWASEVTARGKFRDWVGEHGALPDARVTLVDEAAGAMLTIWPEGA